LALVGESDVSHLGLEGVRKDETGKE
jgi:hypothetical protein